MKGFVLLLLLLAAVGAGLYFFVFDKKVDSTTGARITSVDARFTGAASSLTVVVDVEVEAVTAMPPVGPHVIVTVRCDAARDEVIGDVGLLNNAAAGDSKTDSIELFSRAPFSDQPLKCEITARSSDGSTTASACLELGTTRTGGC